MALRLARQQLLDRRDLGGDAFCAAYSAVADRWLTDLLQAATGGDARGLALLAVGGYGRGELCPYSDLDVVLVHQGRSDVAAVADAVWYPVWDEGIRLDHSVRTPAEVLDVARDDLRAQLGLLDGRVVAGDPAALGSLLADARALWRSQAARWMGVLAEQVEERRQAHGDVAFLLEPDLKQSHGGLRDIVVISLAAQAVPALAQQIDLAALHGPRATLTAARVELHRSTGRALDRLLLQEQDQVASAVGYRDADALMAAIAGAGRTVAWAVGDAWRRQSLWRPARRTRLHRARPRQAPSLRLVEPGVAVRIDPAWPDEGEVVLATDATSAGASLAPPAEAGATMDTGATLTADATLALRVAAVAAERSLPIDRQDLERLAQAVPPPPDPWSEELRRCLVRVLAAGHPAIAALEALDQRGLLVRLLPEWAAVRNRPQRNAYHRFTVDRHLLETAANAAALVYRVTRPDLLLLGALLHDIGKGFPGDHTDVGVELVGRMAPRLGLPEPDVRVLQTVVRHHLLLADLATRRDLDDPATVQAVVGAVGDRSTLDLLAALTEADSLATGPAAWGPWKAGLVADLVRRAATAMAGEDVPVTSPLVTVHHRELMKQVGRTGRSVVEADGNRVTVVAGDRAGLLAAVTGVLALHGLDVRTADVAGEGDYAVEVFTVETSRGRWPHWSKLSDDLEHVLRGRLPLEERLVERARTYAARRRSLSARPPTRSVSIDNGASAISTVVEVRAEDGVGLLHRVTRALFDCELDVVAARVSTLGHEVVDAFYVQRALVGGKVTDPAQIRRIEQAVQAAVSAAPAAES